MISAEQARIINLELKINDLTAERDSALAQVEKLKGTKPELPPFPPQGEGLPRYGIRWNSPTEPLTVPMDDGYWTPYHLALAKNAELVAMVEAFRQHLITSTKLQTAEDAVEWASKSRCIVRLHPAQHLRDRDAEVAEKYYHMGWEHSLSTRADDGDHYGCGKRLAKEFAEKVRRGEV